jgi:transketolase
VRSAFCETLVTRAAHPDFVFLTGDLGFRALEPLRDALGARFINAGVAEQNMISVAAGLARNGLRPWAYSIAPFIYARPFEQVRNDVCLHGLPVVLVGNGGGYGYGVMGATHHALEDYGVLLTLPRMRVEIPAFDADLPAVVARLFEADGPRYLRLGLSEEPRGWKPPAFAPWRKLTTGEGATIVAVGPLAGALWGPLSELSIDIRPNLWALGELPIDAFPEELRSDLVVSKLLCVIEEHVAHGGVGGMLAARLLETECIPTRFVHRAALGYPSGRYGSQKYHRRECGLDPESVIALLTGSREAP